MMNSNRHSVFSVGIIGAGVMGRGIAEACVRVGLNVILTDASVSVAESAVQRLREFTNNPAEVKLACSDADFTEVDLLIEAAPEDEKLKAAILSRIEQCLSKGAIIATNTSSLSLSQLSGSFVNATRFCGLHFCHPVSERRLVEVVAAEKTSADTLARAQWFVTQIGKSPVVVRDSPGFVLNRLLVPYLNEALELLLHGASVESLDRAAADFGMPLRPLGLFDEFGVDVALAVGRSLYRVWPDRIVPAELLIAMYKSRRLGRKCGGGFYRSTADARRGELDPAVVELIQQRQRSDEIVPDDVVKHRLFLPMFFEATRIVEEGLVADGATIDVVLRDGLGLTRHDAGIFAWADAIGYRNLAEWLDDFRPLGERFTPTQTFQNGAGNRRGICESDRISA